MVLSAGTLQILAMVLGGLLLLEQVLAQVPSIKGNSTFQVACNITDSIVAILKKLVGVTPVLPAQVTAIAQQIETVASTVTTTAATTVSPAVDVSVAAP